MSGQPLQLSRKPPGIGERERLVRRATLLARRGGGDHRRRRDSCRVHRAHRFRGRLAHRIVGGDHPPLAVRARARVGEKLGSSATKSEGQQNMLCAYLSAALLVGLGANALFGLWWADPVTALLIAGVALKEGRESWRGGSCCTAPVIAGENCEDDCCR